MAIDNIYFNFLLFALRHTFYLWWNYEIPSNIYIYIYETNSALSEMRHAA